MIGKGAAQAHADSLIRQLVDKAGIPVLSTSMGRGVVSDTHPLSVMAARSLALSHSDVVIIFGARSVLSYALLPSHLALYVSIADLMYGSPMLDVLHLHLVIILGARSVPWNALLLLPGKNLCL